MGIKNTCTWLLVAIVSCLSAQATVINGMLLDGSDQTGLVEATVKLLRASRDSSFVAGTTTDASGVFNIEDVEPGHYIIKASYIGYDDVTRRVTVGKDGRDVNLGVITLTPNTIILGETVVVGVKTPITVKEDTVEYNADTYKTQPNAVVEDLLKRLPGIEVGSDGKITANGKDVKKILIDGKEFFADDPTVASKNIPANMVDKLQVIDRKSDLARLTGVDDGDDETVINLTVKKGMNNGWFGNVTGGYGTNDRYTGNIIANYFNNGNQFTLLGGGNNTNQMGFTDGAGSRFQRFGGERGVTSSQNAGFNFNVGTNDSEKFRAGGDVMYSHSDRDTRSTTARQYLFTDSTSYYDNQSTARDRGHNLRGDFRLKWEFDENNTLDIRPNFSLNFNRSNRNDTSLTRAGDAGMTPVNSSQTLQDNDGKSYEFANRIVYTHKFANHPGRSFSVMANYSYSRVTEDANTLTRSFYYLLDSLDKTDRTQEDRRTTHQISGRVTWTEPLGAVSNARFLEFAYMGNYRYSRADKMVYDVDRAAAAASDEFGDVLNRTFDESLSNQFRNTYYNQSFQIGFRQVRKAYNLNVGLSLNSAMSSSKDLINSARDIKARWAWTVAPFARFRYKFSRTRSLNADYRMRASQPSLTQLQPVADESNPLNIVIGNPELKPTFTHRMNIRFNDFNQQAQRSIMAMLFVNFTQNSIISSTIYDSETGGRTTTYENVNGEWNAMAMNMLSLPLGASKLWFFTSHANLRYSRSKGYNNGLMNTSGAFTVRLEPGIAYRNSVLDVELRPSYSLQTTHNSLQSATNLNVHTYGGNFDLTYTSPWGVVLATDLSYSGTSGYSSGFNTNQWLWNASLAYQFLKGRNASLTLSVYDILGQKKNINRTVTANYIDDSSYNTLTRYGMLTFTYRFTTFKKGEEPERRDDFRRGPGGPGGPPPGGGPGGRPGGGGRRPM